MNKKIIYTPKAPSPIGPYSQAILVDNTIYISGQIPIDASTNKLMISDIISETEQVMKNIEYILQAASMNFTDIVKCTIFVKDLGNFEAINKKYSEYFSKNPPARETVEVSRLPKDVHVEISCIAVR